MFRDLSPRRYWPSLVRTFSGRTSGFALLRCLAIVATLAQVAQAHPGHGLDGGSFSLTHYLSSPLHWLGMLALTLMAAAGVSLVMRALRRFAAQRNAPSAADRA